MFHELARRAAKRLVMEFAACDIPVLVVKGVALAPMLYADPVERPIADADVLVRPRDFFRAIRIARARGWPRKWSSRALGCLNLVVDGIDCDLASSIGPPGTCAVDVEALIDRAEWTEQDLGFPHYRIDIHDHALVMVSDVFKDKFSFAKAHSREDLVRLAIQPDFRAERFLARVREARVETMAWIVARWVLERSESDVWEQVRERLERRPLRRNYAAQYDRLSRLGGGTAGGLSARITARLASDAPLRRVLSLAAAAAGIAINLVLDRA